MQTKNQSTIFRHIFDQFMVCFSSQTAAKMQPHCSRNAAEKQPKCSRNAAEMQSKCRQNSVTSLSAFRLKSSQSCFKSILGSICLNFNSLFVCSSLVFQELLNYHTKNEEFFSHAQHQFINYHAVVKQFPFKMMILNLSIS